MPLIDHSPKARPGLHPAPPAQRARRLAAAWLAGGAILLTTACTTQPQQPEGLTSDRQVQQTLREFNCLKCHSITRDKTGPAWNEVAAKYQGRPDAEAKLFKHLTTAPIVDVDGNPETHKSLQEMDPERVRGLTRWLLSL